MSNPASAALWQTATTSSPANSAPAVITSIAAQATIFIQTQGPATPIPRAKIIDPPDPPPPQIPDPGLILSDPQIPHGRPLLWSSKGTEVEAIDPRDVVTQWRAHVQPERLVELASPSEVGRAIRGEVEVDVSLKLRHLPNRS